MDRIIKLLEHKSELHFINLYILNKFFHTIKLDNKQELVSVTRVGKNEIHFSK